MKSGISFIYFEYANIISYRVCKWIQGNRLKAILEMGKHQPQIFVYARIQFLIGDVIVLKYIRWVCAHTNNVSFVPERTIGFQI